MLQLTAFCYFAFDLKIDGELRELYGGEPRTTWEPRVETSRESMSRDQIIYHHSWLTYCTQPQWCQLWHPPSHSEGSSRPYRRELMRRRPRKVWRGRSLEAGENRWSHMIRRWDRYREWAGDFDSSKVFSPASLEHFHRFYASPEVRSLDIAPPLLVGTLKLELRLFEGGSGQEILIGWPRRAWYYCFRFLAQFLRFSSAFFTSCSAPLTHMIQAVLQSIAELLIDTGWDDATWFWKTGMQVVVWLWNTRSGIGSRGWVLWMEYDISGLCHVLSRRSGI